MKLESDDGGFVEPKRILPEQSRAARGLLGWSQTDLANRAGVTLSTVKNYEVGRSRPIRLSMKAMENALVDAGIRFINDRDDGNRYSVGVYLVWEINGNNEDRAEMPQRIIRASEDMK